MGGSEGIALKTKRIRKEPKRGIKRYVDGLRNGGATQRVRGKA